MVVLNGANNNFIIQKMYYGSASEAFLRSEAVLKIPVRKFLFFFKNFHCLWWPSMYLGGIWCRNICFSTMAKNVKNAIFHILTFLTKKIANNLFCKYSYYNLQKIPSILGTWISQIPVEMTDLRIYWLLTPPHSHTL